MKKLFFVIVLLIAVMAFVVASASIEKENTVAYISKNANNYDSCLQSFDLPASLEVIEEQAFEGTAIICIELPEELTTIGDRAFANIKTLCSIRIPMSTASIAQTAFIGSNNVTITAAPNSYAKTWAKENKLPFSPITVMYAGAGNQSVTGTLSSVSKVVLDTEYTQTQETNRTWRKLEEFQVHDIIEIIANVIQGRAPPMA